MAKIIGIDWGLQTLQLQYWEAGSPKIYVVLKGLHWYGKAFPSFVAFTKSGELLCWRAARRQASAY